jgi:uncharacterized protein DUF1360
VSGYLRCMETIGDKLTEATSGYSDDQPVAGYATAMAAYGTAFGTLALVAGLMGRRLPARLSAGDIVLVTAATHKLSRLLAKDAVTSPLRAPGTRFVGAAGAGELHERVRGRGVRHVFGEMISCPFCLDMWVATAMTAGLVLAPRATRVVTACLTAVAGADFLHLAYDVVKKASGNTG